MSRFDACPIDSKKCVSTLNDGGYPGFDAIPCSGDVDTVLDTVETVVRDFPRTEVVERDGPYLRTTFTSAIFRFTDTVEFEVDADAGVLHFRSESVPYAGSDLGANRKRMTAVTEQLAPRLA